MSAFFVRVVYLLINKKRIRVFASLAEYILANSRCKLIKTTGSIYFLYRVVWSWTRT
jgi:hypothetical protein